MDIAAAKAGLYLASGSARLKACPDTNRYILIRGLLPPIPVSISEGADLSVTVVTRSEHCDCAVPDWETKRRFVQSKVCARVSICIKGDSYQDSVRKRQDSHQGKAPYQDMPPGMPQPPQHQSRL